MAAAKPPFEVVYATWFERVYAYARALVGNQADAEDVAEQAFVKAWDAYPRYRPEGETPSAWLFRIARNCAMDHLRGSARRDRLVRSAGREAAAGEARDPARLAEERMTHAALVALVAALPERQRDVVALRHSGLSFAEVGDLVGASEDAAKMAYHRALKALRKAAAAAGVEA